MMLKVSLTKSEYGLLRDAYDCHLFGDADVSFEEFVRDVLVVSAQSIIEQDIMEFEESNPTLFDIDKRIESGKWMKGSSN